jgi:hypothetical protein
MSGPYREGGAAREDVWDEWLGPREPAVLEQARDSIVRNFEDSRGVLAFVEAQAWEIARLETMVLCLLRALKRAGVVDLDAIAADAQARMATAGIALPRRGRHGLVDPGTLVSCDVCQQQVVAKTTFITGAGTLCEQCYAKEGARSSG